MKSANFEYKIDIPVMVHCTRGDDGSCTIDSVAIPDENTIYTYVHNKAKEIKQRAEVIV